MAYVYEASECPLALERLRVVKGEKNGEKTKLRYFKPCHQTQVDMSERTLRP